MRGCAGLGLLFCPALKPHAPTPCFLNFVLPLVPLQSKPIRLVIDEVVVEMVEPNVLLPPRGGPTPPPKKPGPLDAPHRCARDKRQGKS